MKTRLLAVGSGMVVLAAALLLAGCGGGGGGDCEDGLLRAGPPVTLVAPDYPWDREWSELIDKYNKSDSTLLNTNTPGLTKGWVEEWRDEQIGLFQERLDYLRDADSRCRNYIGDTNNPRKADTARRIKDNIYRTEAIMLDIEKQYRKAIHLIESR